MGLVGTSQEISQWLWVQDREQLFEIKEYKKKRSLNANSYCWVLLQKLADKLNTTKEELYRNSIVCEINGSISALVLSRRGIVIQ